MKYFIFIPFIIEGLAHKKTEALSRFFYLSNSVRTSLFSIDRTTINALQLSFDLDVSEPISRHYFWGSNVRRR